MNIIHKIKKFFLSIMAAIGTLFANTFAAVPFPTNDVPMATFYGVQEPIMPVSSIFIIIGKLLVIPIIVIVGVIVYFKNKKKNKD